MKQTIKSSIVTSMIIFSLSACTSNDIRESEYTTVYINNGGIQCESDGKSSKETAALLSNNRVVVNSSQCGQLTNIMVATMCGGPTVNINLHEIKADDIKKAEAIGFTSINTLIDGGNIGYNITDCK